MTLLAVACAVAAMLVDSAATLLEAAGSSRVGPRRPLSTQPLYLLGLLVDSAGWALSVVALRVLPVFAVQAVQAVLAGSVAVTAVAARGGDPRAPRGPERVGVVAVPLLRRRGGGAGRRLVTAVVAGACNGGAALCVRAVHGASATSAVLPGLVGTALPGDGVRAGRAPVLAVGLALAVAGVVVSARGGTATTATALREG